MKCKKILLLIMIISIVSPLIFSNIEVKSDYGDYPILIWDQAPNSYVGERFWIMFTAFTDSNETLNIQIWIDEVDLEWESNKVFYVNEEVQISTADQLPGPGHSLRIIATDYANRTSELSVIMTIDTIDPVFNYLNVYPFDGQRIYLNKDEQCLIEWDVYDEHFFEIRIFKNNAMWINSRDAIGDKNLTFYSTVSFEMIIRVEAIDDANNTVSVEYELYYNIEEGEYIPIEDVEALKAEQRVAQMSILVAGLVSTLLAVIITYACSFPGARKKKDLNY